MRRRAVIVILILAALAAAVAFVPPVRARAMKLLRNRVSVEERLGQIGPAARERLKPGFAAAGASYPPSAVTVLVLKAERRVEVYAPGADGRRVLVRKLAVRGASGGPGPKLRRGDNQVPEGVYPVESLNPNSLYHVSLRVGYPSADDLARCRDDGRDPATLGGDIMIHGGSVSVGCVSVGDEGAEELFTLAADAGVRNVELLILPQDFGDRPAIDTSGMPAWMGRRYDGLRERVAGLAR